MEPIPVTLRETMEAWLVDPNPDKRLHARNRLAIMDGGEVVSEPQPPRIFRRYDGPLPNCLYASPGLETSCRPIRCHAHYGVSCGGSHTTLEHCQRCLTPPSRKPT